MSFKNYYKNNKKQYLDRCKNIDRSTLAEESRDEAFDIDELVHLMAAYHGAISFIDEKIGRLMDELKQRGEYDNAMIILTADHGENLTENGAFVAHNKLFDETTKVPLMIKFPANQFKGQTCPQQVELADIYPTILNYYKIPLPGPIRGSDLMPYLTGEKKLGKPYAVSEHVGKFQRSIRDGQWQFIETIPPDKWRVKDEEDCRLEIGRRLKIEGDVLLISRENNRNNHLNDHRQEALRLKKEADRICQKL